MSNRITKIDLISGYLIIRTNREYIPKTACSTRVGHYVYNVKSFVVKNARMFQSWMNQLLRFVGKICIVIISYEILISSRTGAYWKILLSSRGTARKHQTGKLVDRMQSDDDLQECSSSHHDEYFLPIVELVGHFFHERLHSNASYLCTNKGNPS